MNLKRLLVWFSDSFWTYYFRISVKYLEVHVAITWIGICMKVKVKVKLLSRVRLFATPWTVAHQAPPSMGFSKQEYWSGLPLPSPGDLPDPGIEPRSPAFQADALTSEPPVKPGDMYSDQQKTMKEHNCEMSYVKLSLKTTTRQPFSKAAVLDSATSEETDFQRWGGS